MIKCLLDQGFPLFREWVQWEGVTAEKQGVRKNIVIVIVMEISVVSFVSAKTVWTWNESFCLNNIGF